MATELPPASFTAVSTCASSERPETSCSTLGVLERIRVPSPAASTIERHVRSFIPNLLRISRHFTPGRHSGRAIGRKGSGVGGSCQGPSALLRRLGRLAIVFPEVLDATTVPAHRAPNQLAAGDRFSLNRIR